jgi:hypothetical protein
LCLDGDGSGVLGILKVERAGTIEIEGLRFQAQPVAVSGVGRWSGVAAYPSAAK